VLFVSNDGPSTQIDAHGRIVRAIPMGAPAVLDGAVTLGSGTTLHQRVQPAIAPLFALGALAVSLGGRRRRPAPRAISARAWAIGVAAAVAVACALAAASDGLVRRALAVDTDLSRDALAEPPDVAIAGALGSADDARAHTLAYLASHLGAPRGAGEIAAHLEPSRTDAPALAAAARALGFSAAVDASSYDALRSRVAPFVAPLAGRRLLVVMEITREAVRAFDPTRGFVSLPRERFERAWDGEVVTIRPAPKEGPRRARIDHVAERAD